MTDGVDGGSSRPATANGGSRRTRSGRRSPSRCSTRCSPRSRRYAPGWPWPAAAHGRAVAPRAAGLMLSVRELGVGAVPRRRRDPGAGRLRAAHRPQPRAGRQRRVRLAARDARPAGRLAGAGRRRRRRSPRRWWRGWSARGGRVVYSAPASRVLVARRPGDGRARAPTAATCGPPARCWPTCRPRRSTSTWSAQRQLPPRLVEDLEHFRWDGATVKVDWARAAPGSRGRTRPPPAPARSISAPTWPA